MRNIIKLLIIIIIVSSCSTKQIPIGTKTGASKYNPTSNVLHPQFKIFHETDDYSKLYFKLFTKELRFSSANTKKTNQAVLKISYKITSSMKSNNIIDSAKTSITIKNNAKQTSIISFFKIKNINLEQYIIEVKLYDFYSNKKSKSYIRVNKSNDSNEQYYISFKGKNQKPIFSEYFKPYDTLFIKTQNTNDAYMSVVHYNTEFEMAKPPFSSEKQKAINLKKDTSWKISIISQKAKFYSNKKGIYIIRANKNKVRGMMKIQFENSYPLISKSSEMIEATEYILTEQQKSEMLISENKKLSIDNFWIKTSRSKEQAKELIKIWYNRATYSNYYFTSYKKGIKTDRGMVYTVFGPPDDIKYFDDAEKWVYVNTKSMNKLGFVFVKQANSISKNDYTLIRDGKYKSAWNRAIKTWRSGRVFKY